jgi:hypothetical protein
MEKKRFSGVIACNGSIAQVAPCGAGDATGTIGPVLTHAELGHEGLNDIFRFSRGFHETIMLREGLRKKASRVSIGRAGANKCP